MDDSYLDFAVRVHSYLAEFIRAGDQKAAFVLVASAALLGWLTAQPAGGWRFAVRIAGMVLVGLAAALAVLCVKPRQHRLTVGLIAWNGILRSGSTRQYHESISRLSDGGAHEITTHSYALASILRRKYRLLWLAVWAFIAGGVMTVVLLFANDLLQGKAHSGVAIIHAFLPTAAATSQQVPWWVDRVAGPIVFTVVGATLGFSFGRLKDWLDDRKMKRVFLKSVRVELLAVRGHLEGTLQDATGTRDKLDKGISEALHLATTFQTGVYSSQVGKLKNVFDPLVIEVIQFYDALANVERIKSRLTVVSFELATAPVELAEKQAAVAQHYRSTLDEVIKRINQLLPTSEALIGKLPEH